MTRPDSDLANFSRLIEALRPWLGQIIFIGGRAHRLYRERPEAASVAYEALQTDDADVALGSSPGGSSNDVTLDLFGNSTGGGGTTRHARPRRGWTGSRSSWRRSGPPGASR